MKTENIVKCSLEPTEEKMIINAIQKGTHDFDDLIAMINDLVDDAFQEGVNHSDGDNNND
tara:strand:+ start:302 stop:481 length:180 start_codon:yes stop_codon:yes gene_type:complete